MANINIIEGFDIFHEISNWKDVATAKGYAVTGTNPDIQPGYNGGYCFHTTGATYTNNLEIPIPNYSTIFLGMRFKMLLSGENQTDRDYAPIVFCNDDDNFGQLAIQQSASNAFRVYRGNTLLGTTSISITPGKWCYLKIKVRASNTIGQVVIEINGVEALNLTDQNTLQTGTTEAYSKIRLGNAFVTDSLNDTYYDDIYISDNGFADGLCIVKTMAINGDGNTTMFVPSVGNNWECVNNSSGTFGDKYVDGFNSDDLDLYTNTPLDIDSNFPIKAVQLNVIAQKTTADARIIDICSFYDAQLTHLEQLILTENVWNNAYTTLTTNPQTSEAWTKDSLSASEFGQIITT